MNVHFSQSTLELDSCATTRVRLSSLVTSAQGGRIDEAGDHHGRWVHLLLLLLLMFLRGFGLHLLELRGVAIHQIDEL